MKRKVADQVEDMKKQTFGVEIEMAEITRKKVVNTVAEYFKTTSTVHYEGGNYRTWYCKDKNGRTWRVMSDASIVSSSESAELVTPILNYSDMADLQEITRKLRHAGAVSNPKYGCGLHVHIGAQGHTAQTLRNLVNIMASHERLIKEALKLDGDRVRKYCRMVDPIFLSKVNSIKPKTMERFADVWYTSHYATYGRNNHYNDSRYHMLNLHATFTKGTVEFRLFQFDNPTVYRKGGLHAGQLKSYIQLCLALSQMAKEVRSASAKPQQNQNPKYAMRTCLLRLGFIGEEFKTAREFLTKNLSGDAAFRHSRSA